MNTQKENYYRLIKRLEEAGFSFEEANKLRRIEMTLHRWSEHECNGNIQREGEEGDGTPRWYSSYEMENEYEPKGYRIPDREKGALKRLAKLMEGHPDYVSYHQGDPRGCALYIVKRSELGGQDIDSVYTRGIAVCD